MRATDLPLRLPAGAVMDVARQGHAYVPGSLPASWTDRLAGELDTEAMVPVPEEVGEVRQRAMQLKVALGAPGFPALQALAGRLTDVLAARTQADEEGVLEALSSFRPDEASFMRYEGADTGISPHRDHARHRLLVAVFTLRGGADFAVVADRAGTKTLAQARTTPGDLWLLRGPGLGGRDEGRPLHTVSAPRDGPRLSLALRMNSTVLNRPYALEAAQAGRPGAA